MKTTVVIPNYNGKEYLENCLKSLEENTKVPFRLILVDNGSRDGSAQEALRLHPWITLVTFSENKGFDAAVNEGIRRADTPFIFLLNNDTTIQPDCIESLERRMEADPSLFSVSARMVDMKNPAVMDGAGDLYSALGWAYAIGKSRPADRYNTPRYIFSACAGAAMYRAEYLQHTGLFDEIHFAYLEDIDIGYRALIHGYRNAYEPAAVVRHAGSATTGSRYNSFKIMYSARNNIYLIYKNMPLLQILINLPLLTAGFLTKALFFTAKGYGFSYLTGLRSGFRICFSPVGRAKKVRFKMRNLGNYIFIQVQLWVNIFRRF